jgi:hypothetical protein
MTPTRSDLKNSQQGHKEHKEKGKRAWGEPVGLIINFHELILKNGIRRLVLKENQSS